jgi:hypothetical protein
MKKCEKFLSVDMGYGGDRKITIFFAVSERNSFLMRGNGKTTYSSLAKSHKFRILYACVLWRNARALAIRQLNSGEFLL